MQAGTTAAEASRSYLYSAWAPPPDPGQGRREPRSARNYAKPAHFDLIFFQGSAPNPGQGRREPKSARNEAKQIDSELIFSDPLFYHKKSPAAVIFLLSIV